MSSAQDVTSKLVRPIRGGQITIPEAFREALGITDDTLLRVTLAGGELRIAPVQVAESRRGSAWLRELYELFEPVRRETGQYSEEEVYADIDAAIREVRARGSSA